MDYIYTDCRIVCITSILSAIKGKLTNLSSVIYGRTSISEMWNLKNSFELLQKMNSFYGTIQGQNHFKHLIFQYCIHLPHQKLKERMHMLVNRTFLHKNGSCRYKYIVVNGDRIFFTNEETSVRKKCDETIMCQMIDFLIDNIYIKIGNPFV